MYDALFKKNQLGQFFFGFLVLTLKMFKLFFHIFRKILYYD